MAVARIDQLPYRRYSSPASQQYRIERPALLSGRALVVGVVVAGALLQHLLVSAPLEPQPARLSAAAGVALAAPAPALAAGALSAPEHTTRPMTARPLTTKGASGHAGARPPAGPVTLPSLKAPKITIRTSMRAHPSTPGIVLPPVGAFGDAARVAMAANPEGAIKHIPSVSVGAIRAALRDAGSPVLGAGYADHKDAAEYIWDAGRVLGVDPAVVMAIFDHESAFGTRGMARQTLSIGNIRPLPGQPQLDGYRLYSSWQEGIDDCYRLLLSYARNGATTIPQAIPVWAPPSDNNDDSAYISAVLDTMNSLYSASAKP